MADNLWTAAQDAERRVVDACLFSGYDSLTESLMGICPGCQRSPAYCRCVC